jgi:hypothetical protein
MILVHERSRVRFLNDIREFIRAGQRRVTSADVPLDLMARGKLHRDALS